MSQFKALSANTTTDPVLFLNAKATRTDIAENAQHRLAAAKDLMQAMACMTIQTTDNKSLGAVCDVAYLLLSDAQDLFNAYGFYGGKNND